MTPYLLANISTFKDYYLVISGTYHNRILSILDKSLQIISEHEFIGVQMWGEDFHVDETNSKVLISVTTTETFPLESKSYQGFHTLWYELKEELNGFQFYQIDKWEKSDIRRIKSKVVDGQRIWLCFRDLNYINQTGKTGQQTVIGRATTSELIIPKFDYTAGFKHIYLSHNFDFEVSSSDILIAGISSLSNDIPTIIRINKNKKNVEFIELDIPLKKLHNFQDTRLVKKGNQMFAFFWITSSEYCKKYVFEIYSVKINNILSESIFNKALDSDYVHSFQWNKKCKVAFKIGTGETPCLLGEINELGEIIIVKEFETVAPVLLTDNDIIIATYDERKKMKTIK